MGNYIDYLNRKMFLDPAGPVTIQQFEEDCEACKL